MTNAVDAEPAPATRPSDEIHRLLLTSDDNAALTPLLTDIAAYDTIENLDLIRHAPVLARALPAHLHSFLEDFRIREPASLCLVSGLAIDQFRLGPTPRHWRDSQYDSPTFAQEIFFLLCAAVLGDLFGWPRSRTAESCTTCCQSRVTSTTSLVRTACSICPGTEDAFHPCRDDYVALMCLKNPDVVETVVCDAGQSRLVSARRRRGLRPDLYVDARQLASAAKYSIDRRPDSRSAQDTQF